MTSAPITVGEAIDIAINCFKNAEYENVLGVCDEILRAEPANADALHLKALANANCGDLGQAISDIKQALIIRPNNFELLNNLGNFYKAAGAFENARECYTTALEFEPQCHPALFNLGNVLAELGDIDEAKAVYAKAIKMDPSFADAYYNLGLILKREGNVEDALSNFKKCIVRNTDHVQAQVEIGNCFSALGQTEEALNAYKVASVVDPNVGETFNNIGVLLTEQGNYTEARTMLETALRLNPDFSAAQNNLGVVQYFLGDYEDAADSFSEVIAVNPENAQAYRNLAKCLAETGAHDDAILTYRTSLRFDSTASDVWVELAAVYAAAGYSQQATDIFDQIHAQRPDSFVPILGRAIAALPKFYGSPEAISAARARFSELLSEAESQLNLSSEAAINDAVFAIGLVQPQHLIYQDADNRELLNQFGKLTAKVMAAKYPCYAKLLTKRVPAADEPLRVGVVGVECPGILANLNAAKFELIRYSTRGIAFEKICQKIRDDQVHVLVYPRLSDSAAWQMASLRIAPVQCVTWQHGQTTGLPEVDFMLSGELLEGEDSQSQYSEKLVKLVNTGLYYEQPVVPGYEQHAEPQLRADSIRIMCGQPPQNYLPEQDHVFRQIAERLPNVQFIFAEASQLTDALKQRIGLDDIVVLPYVTPADVHLFMDSFALNDFECTIAALNFGVPLVTFTGKRAVSRISSALLRQIEVTDTIADTTEKFVDIVVKLATDETFRTDVAKRLNDRKHWAYRDQEAIASLEKFLLSV